MARLEVASPRRVPPNEFAAALIVVLTGCGLLAKIAPDHEGKSRIFKRRRRSRSRVVTLTTDVAGRGTPIELAEGVAELGGLHVIASERHDARRLDRQLFQRGGRNGEPATCEAFLCADDDVLEHAGGGFLQRAARVPLLAPWAVRAAQLRTERQYAAARRRLVQLDETLDTTLAFSGRSE